MTTTVVTTLAQLAEANGKYDTINVVGLDLRGQTIKAKTVMFTGCSGDVINIDADYLWVEGGMFMDVITRASEVQFIKAAFNRLRMSEPAETLVINTTIVFSVTGKSISEVHISRSWISSILMDTAQSVAIYDSYIQNAFTRQDHPFIFSQNSAINRTNWPIIDGGTNAHGDRLNVFRGRILDHLPVRTPENMECSEETILVTVGHHQFTAVHDAGRRWMRRKKGILELVDKAVELLKQREASQ